MSNRILTAFDREMLRHDQVVRLENPDITTGGTCGLLINCLGHPYSSFWIEINSVLVGKARQKRRAHYHRTVRKEEEHHHPSKELRQEIQIEGRLGPAETCSRKNKVYESKADGLPKPIDNIGFTATFETYWHGFGMGWEYGKVTLRLNREGVPEIVTRLFLVRNSITPTNEYDPDLFLCPLRTPRV